jgi:hypothetical protein
MAIPPHPNATALKAEKRVAGWFPKLPENTEFIALRPA